MSDLSEASLLEAMAQIRKLFVTRAKRDLARRPRKVYYFGADRERMELLLNGLLTGTEKSE